ncbi:MAG: Foldase protein PrsA 2 [Syntrophus sp. SKADARSKE-3]|nr:Foldase protein PrsA 2 [Syntrophus sp. SKADARSKE-3]
MLIFALFVTWGCQKREPVYVASINDEKITMDEYRGRLFEQMNAPGTKAPIIIPDAERFKDEVLNIMIMERLMLQKARELSLSVSGAELDKAVNDIKKDYSEDRFQQNFSTDKASFDLWRSELKNRILMEKLVQAEVNSKISVSDTEAAAYYKTHMNNFKSLPRVHVAQIVVRDQAKAEAILKRLNTGAPFDTVAKEESIAPEAEKGGDMGFFPRGILPEEIDSVVFMLPVGKTSRIVKSLYGYHIFKIMKRETGGQKPFAEVKVQIITDLQKKKEEEAYVQWLQTLRSKATIRINSDVMKNLDIKSKPGEK